MMVFVVVRLKGRARLLDGTPFSNRAFTAVVIAAFVFGAGNLAASYAIPMFIQQVRGLAVATAGLLPISAGLFATCRPADRLPERVSILFGPCLFALGAILMATADIRTHLRTPVPRVRKRRRASGQIGSLRGSLHSYRSFSQHYANINGIPQPMSGSPSRLYDAAGDRNRC